MNSLSILDEVTHELEQNANIGRIKKIVYCACKGKWENDPQQLQQANLRELVQELFQTTGSVENLELLLDRIVAKVNKRHEYEAVAQTILGQIERLYAGTEDSTEKELTSASSSQSSSLGSNNPSQSISTVPLPQETEKLKVPGNLFEIRQKILQRTNSLRAKILVFSLLEREFSFTESDWSLLKTKELDTLLRHLFHRYPTLPELESQLHRVANNLQNSEEYLQSAGVIIQAMIPCYITQPQISSPQDNFTSENQSSSDSLSVADEAEQDSAGQYAFVPGNSQEIMDEDPDQDSAGQVSYGESSNFYLGEITGLVQEMDSGYYDGYEHHFLESDSSAYAQRSIEANHHHGEYDDDMTVLPVSNLSTSFSAADADSSGGQRALSSFSILDSIKQKLGVEEEVKSLVNQSVNSVMSHVETEFRQLEFFINMRLHLEEDEQVLRKYKFLREFIESIQKVSGKFMDVLHDLEAEERKRINPHAGPTYSPPETEDSDSGKHQKIIESAKQGNPKGIAAFLNHFLHAKGITVIVFAKEDYLHIILEAAKLPNQQVAASFVQKKIASLKAKSLTSIKVHGRQSGKKSVAWSELIEL